MHKTSDLSEPSSTEPLSDVEKATKGARAKNIKFHKKWTEDKLGKLWVQCFKDTALFESSLGFDPKEVLTK